MKKVKNNFSELLKMHCKARGMKHNELAKTLGITQPHLSILGGRHGITIHLLDKIIKLLKIKEKDEIVLRHAAVYTNPKQTLVVDRKLLTKLENQVTNHPDLEDFNDSMICATLKFVGVKFKIGKM